MTTTQPAETTGQGFRGNDAPLAGSILGVLGTWGWQWEARRRHLEASLPAARGSSNWARCTLRRSRRSAICVRQENPSASTTASGAASIAGSRFWPATATETS